MEISLSPEIEFLFNSAWSIIPFNIQEVIKPNILLVFDNYDDLERYVQDSPLKDKKYSKNPKGWCIPTSNPNYAKFKIYLSKELHEINPVTNSEKLPQSHAIYFILHELAHAVEISEAYFSSLRDEKINLDELASHTSEVRAMSQAFVWATRAIQLRLAPDYDWAEIAYTAYMDLRVYLEHTGTPRGNG